MSSTNSNTRAAKKLKGTPPDTTLPTTPDDGVKADEKSEAAAASILATASSELEVTTRLRATGALFNIERDQRKETGPIMSGSIRDDRGITIPVSLFPEVAESAEIYASLALGGKDRTRYYGKLFHSQIEAGNGPAYSGYIVVLPVTSKDQYSAEQWDKAERLQICGWRRRSADGKARISLQIAPRFVDSAELAF